MSEESGRFRGKLWYFSPAVWQLCPPQTQWWKDLIPYKEAHKLTWWCKVDKQGFIYHTHTHTCGCEYAAGRAFVNVERERGHFDGCGLLLGRPSRSASELWKRCQGISLRVTHIGDDGNNNVWTGCSEGLSWMDTSSLKTTVFIAANAVRKVYEQLIL